MTVDWTQFGGVILCGGKSLRMGRPKWSLPIGAETFLQRTFRTLSEVVSPIVIVAAQDQDVTSIPPGAILVRDEIPNSGPLAGIAAGIRELARCSSVEAAYVTSCDAPLVRPGFVREMIAYLGQHDLALPRDAVDYQPLAGVYRVSLADRIDQLLAENQRRTASLVQVCNTLAVGTEQLRKVDPNLDSLRNINTPEEYEALLREL